MDEKDKKNNELDKENSKENLLDNNSDDTIDNDLKNNLDSTNDEDDVIDEIVIEEDNENIDSVLNEDNKAPKNKKKYNFNNIILVSILLSLIFLIITSILGLRNDNKKIAMELAIPKWEYKVVYLEATESGVYMQDELNPSKIELTEDMINTYGLEGWELVDTYLEMETVHPNYGNEDYVTGLQPNIRPQRLVLMFKKPL